MTVSGLSGIFTFLLLPNNAGFAGRFGNEEIFARSLGFPISGFLANFIGFLCIYFSTNSANKYQFIIYLVLSNTGALFHLSNMIIFFKSCQNNDYAINIKNKPEPTPQEKQCLEIELLNQTQNLEQYPQQYPEIGQTLEVLEVSKSDIKTSIKYVKKTLI